MVFQNFPDTFRPSVHGRRLPLRALCFAILLAGLPASTQPASDNLPPPQVLPALPPPAEFLAAVQAHPDVIITQAAFLEASTNAQTTLQAHGEDSPLTAQAFGILALRRQALDNAIIASATLQIGNLQNQGHALVDIQAAYADVNLFAIN